MKVEDKRALRFRLMQAIYELTDGDQSKSVHLSEIAPLLGVSFEVADGIAQYLVEERLLEWSSFGHNIEITHAGVNEVEEALEAPNRATVHFPAVNVIHIENM